MKTIKSVLFCIFYTLQHYFLHGYFNTKNFEKYFIKTMIF